MQLCGIVGKIVGGICVGAWDSRQADRRSASGHVPMWLIFAGAHGSLGLVRRLSTCWLRGNVCRGVGVGRRGCSNKQHSRKLEGYFSFKCTKFSLNSY